MNFKNIYIESISFLDISFAGVSIVAILKIAKTL